MTRYQTLEMTRYQTLKLTLVFLCTHGIRREKAKTYFLYSAHFVSNYVAPHTSPFVSPEVIVEKVFQSHNLSNQRVFNAGRFSQAIMSFSSSVKTTTYFLKNDSANRILQLGEGRA